MPSPQHVKVLILGSGPAGLTAAVYAARANLQPVLLHGPEPGGQLTTTTEVENYPGFSKGILGPDLMREMEEQAKRFGTVMHTGLATKVDLSQHPFRVTRDNDEFLAETLIIATGATARLLGLPSEKELMGYGVSTCATCDGAFFREQLIAVVGGGDSAAEEALFLTKFGSKVYLIHRRDSLRASKIMQDRVLKHPKIEVLWNKVVTEILGTRKDGVRAAKLEDTITGATSELPVNAVFLGIGHTPNTALFKGQLEMDENGYLTTAPRSTRTNIPGVFACGDVQDPLWRQAVTAAGTGCIAAIEAERWLESRE